MPEAERVIPGCPARAHRYRAGIHLGCGGGMSRYAPRVRAAGALALSQTPGSTARFKCRCRSIPSRACSPIPPEDMQQVSTRRRCRSSTAPVGSIRIEESCIFRSRRPCRRSRGRALPDGPTGDGASAMKRLLVALASCLRRVLPPVSAQRAPPPDPTLYSFQERPGAQLPARSMFLRFGRSRGALERAFPRSAADCGTRLFSLLEFVRRRALELVQRAGRREARGRPRLRACGLEHRPSRDERRGASGQDGGSRGVRTPGG